MCSGGWKVRTAMTLVPGQSLDYFLRLRAELQLRNMAMSLLTGRNPQPVAPSQLACAEHSATWPFRERSANVGSSAKSVKRSWFC